MKKHSATTTTLVN